MDTEKSIKYIDEVNRIILINDDFEPEYIAPIVLKILTINEEDAKQESKQKYFVRQPIKSYINSYGGLVTELFSLINVIISSKTPIYTYCTGCTYSSGALLLISGHKRFAYKRSHIMIHSVFTGGIYDRYQQFIESAEKSKDIQKMIWDYVICNTNILNKQLDEITIKKQDWFMYGEEAKELGIIDEVIDDE